MIIKKIILGAVTAFAVAGYSVSALAATEIQWWHAMGGANGERVDKIAADFNATQSEYKVMPSYKGNYTETMTAAIAAFRAREQPHIVQVFEVGTATMMAAKGAVYPVEQMMKDAGEPFDKSIYLPAVISYYQTPDGDLLSMPFNSSTPVLWYNRDAFKKAGVSAPPKTWSEMKSASEKLVAAGYKCGFTFGWQSWVMIENYSSWHDLPVGTKENGFAGLDTNFTFNNDKVKARIASIADWSKDKLFTYGGRRGDSLSMYTNGECGMWMNSSAYYASIKKQAKFDFGQTMLPLDTDVASSPQNSIIGGATLWVLKGHDKGDYKGVAKFMTYLSSPEVQAWWHQETGYVPITTPAYELSKKQGFGNFVQVRDIINEEMEAIWNGSKTAAQGLDDAASRGDRLLRRFERANK